MRDSISTNAARLRELYDRIAESFCKQPHGPEHHAACEEFHRLYDSLAFPGGLKAGLAQLKNGDPDTIEFTVQFLELNPRFFGSGYHKESMLRRLKRLPLTDLQQSRLAALMLRSVDGGPRREFRGYSRLVRRIHPSDLLDAINARLSSPNPEVVRRAIAVLHILDSSHSRHTS